MSAKEIVLYFCLWCAFLFFLCFQHQKSIDSVQYTENRLLWSIAQWHQSCIVLRNDSKKLLKELKAQEKKK